MQIEVTATYVSPWKLQTTVYEILGIAKGIEETNKKKM